MNFRFRHLITLWISPLIWRFSPRSASSALLEFAQVELDSAWQSMKALENVRDRKTRVLLFEHAFEEMHHFDLFNEMGMRKSPDNPKQPTTAREPLLKLDNPSKRDEVEFLAVLYFGESEIHKDFLVYQKAFPDEEIRTLFSKIVEDEIHHAEDSSETLDRMAAQEKISLFWIKFRQHFSFAYKRYTLLVSKFGVIPLNAIMVVIYYALGFTFTHQARKLFKDARDTQTEFLIQQQIELNQKLKEVL